MAKKTHVKVRMVPEAKPDSPFFYYVKKPAGGEKAKVKLSARKYNPSTRKHEVFVEKKLPPHSKYLFSFKISFFVINIRPYHIFPNTICNFRVYLICKRFFSYIFQNNFNSFIINNFFFFIFKF